MDRRISWVPAMVLAALVSLTPPLQAQDEGPSSRQAQGPLDLDPLGGLDDEPRFAGRQALQDAHQGLAVGFARRAPGKGGHGDPSIRSRDPAFEVQRKARWTSRQRGSGGR